MQESFDIEFIRKKSNESLVDLGMPSHDANVLVDSMLAADINGVSTHGIRMLPAYIQKINKGAYAFTQPIVIKQFPSFTIIDAQNNIGAVSASYAVEIAIKQAEVNGIHIVFSRNSNTFGPAFYYVEKIANSGMIGFVCSNAPAAMPAVNGLEAMLGTNPFAFAMPTKSYGNVVMDMATSIVAKSRFGIAKAKGEKLGQGWVLDRNGNPTIDPDEGIKGFVLPMAGFKGYGIAMMIDIMSGFLSGAGFLSNVGKFYSENDTCMNVGHMIVAVNPKIIFDGDFLLEADKYVETLKKSKVMEGKTIVLPGDDRKSYKKEALKNGISLTQDVVDKLEILFNEKLCVKNQVG